MSRGSSFLESSSTPEEDSYRYRIEWDDRVSSAREMLLNGMKIKHYGPGFKNVSGFDNAWDVYNDYKEHPDYRGVRLIQIDSNDNETQYAP